MLSFISFPDVAEAVAIIAAGLVLGVVLVLVELLNRSGKLHPEVARKSIHISAGLIMISLPLFMDRSEIFWTNLAFLAGVLVLTGWLHIFKAVHAVRRWTIGEFLYPLSGVLVVLLFESLQVYSFSVLVLLFSDSLAGLVGRKYGGQSYKVWRGYKTYIGSLAFFIATLLLFIGLVNVTDIAITPMVWITIGISSAILTLVEAVSGGGLDNLTVPLTAAFLANYLLG